MRLPQLKDNPVPCKKAKCVACCTRGYGIEVLPEDMNEHLDAAVVGIEGMRLLRVTTEGVCVHLDPKKGCTVYSHRPKACRTFDCRHAYFANIYDRRPVETKILLAAMNIRRLDPIGTEIERKRYTRRQVKISRPTKGPDRAEFTRKDAT